MKQKVAYRSPTLELQPIARSGRNESHLFTLIDPQSEPAIGREIEDTNEHGQGSASSSVKAERLFDR